MTSRKFNTLKFTELDHDVEFKTVNIVWPKYRSVKYVM